MAPGDSRRTGGDDPDEALRRIEERVQQVRDLGSFHVRRREDGRFYCELTEPISELEPGEIHQVLTTLESLADAIRSQLEGEGGA